MINRISELIIKHLNGELTPEEQAELNEWLGDSEKDKKFFEQFSDKNYVSGELDSLYAYDEEKNWEKLIRKYPVQSAPVVPIVKRTGWWKYMAAAAIIIIIIGAGGYLAFFNKQSQSEQVQIEPQQQRFKNDIKPGQEGAILTLGDGSKVILDSAQNGTLAQQGNVILIKRDGQLNYEGTGSSEISYNTMTTPRGRQYSVMLADGSKVWLNAASSITYPTAFKGNERKVIISGEAYFEIAHNANMPFIVEKGDMNVKVLGTHFNVNAYDDELTIRTTLIEGSVQVGRSGLPTPGLPTGQAGSRFLTPGQQAQVDRSNEISVVNADLEEVIAWKNGYFNFRNSTIESIMRQVERWYDVDVEYEGKPARLFNGEVPRSVNASTLFRILESTGWVHFKIDGKKVTVMK